MFRHFLIFLFVFAVTVRADISSSVKIGLEGLSIHISNVEGFKGNTARIFERLSKGQRDDIDNRLTYVIRQSRMTRKALDRFGSAYEELAGAGKGSFSSGARSAALLKTIDAFEDYRALFDVAVNRCFVDYPEPRYLRIKRRLEELPWYRYAHRGALRRELEKAFIEYAGPYLKLTVKVLQPRHDAFFHSLKNLQYSSSCFDMGMQYRFDRAFYSYQALYADKRQPGYGVPVYSEFPVDAPLTKPIVFRPTSYAKQYSDSLKGRDVTRLLPEAYLDIKSLPPDALSREARRIKELQDLVESYQRGARRGDKQMLDEAWQAYAKLRDRWDKVEN